MEARFRKLRWAQEIGADEWRAQVERTRELSYAVDYGNFVSGMTVVAAPVLGKKGRMTHALALIGLNEEIGRHDIKAVGARLASDAREISAALG